MSIHDAQYTTDSVQAEAHSGESLWSLPGQRLYQLADRDRHSRRRRPELPLPEPGHRRRGARHLQARCSPYVSCCTPSIATTPRAAPRRREQTSTITTSPPVACGVGRSPLRSLSPTPFAWIISCTAATACSCRALPSATRDWRTHLHRAQLQQRPGLEAERCGLGSHHGQPRHTDSQPGRERSVTGDRPSIHLYRLAVAQSNRRHQLRGRLGPRVHPAANLEFRGAAFHQHNQDLIGLSGGFLNTSAGPYYLTSNVGDSDANGLDLELRGTLRKNYRWGLNYRPEWISDASRARGTERRCLR